MLVAAGRLAIVTVGVSVESRSDDCTAHSAADSEACCTECPIAHSSICPSAHSSVRLSTHSTTAVAAVGSSLAIASVAASSAVVVSVTAAIDATTVGWSGRGREASTSGDKGSVVSMSSPGGHPGGHAKARPGAVSLGAFSSPSSCSNGPSVPSSRIVASRRNAGTNRTSRSAGIL
uniref:Uncharacterized protein n=1 Tax=Ixodes ricinus TaxID=34613 RepID=A0A6B0UYM3_IXORI